MTADIIFPETIVRETRGPLTPEDLRARLFWLAEYIRLNGWAPTHRETGRGWGVSAAAVRHSLEAMQRHGWLVFGGQARQIWITELGHKLVRGTDGTNKP